MPLQGLLQGRQDRQQLDFQDTAGPDQAGPGSVVRHQPGAGAILPQPPKKKRERGLPLVAITVCRASGSASSAVGFAVLTPHCLAENYCQEVEA